MVTVIIPALNEEKTVGVVVKLALQSKNVSEVIVVDDKSMDETVEAARLAGATVITSTELGKGASVKQAATISNNQMLFPDADIVTYKSDVVELLSNPIINGKADFVKSYFSRQAGIVTNHGNPLTRTKLIAKPLKGKAVADIMNDVDSIKVPDFNVIIPILS